MYHHNRILIFVFACVHVSRFNCLAHPNSFDVRGASYHELVRPPYNVNRDKRSTGGNAGETKRPVVTDLEKTETSSSSRDPRALPERYSNVDENSLQSLIARAEENNHGSSSTKLIRHRRTFITITSAIIFGVVALGILGIIVLRIVRWLFLGGSSTSLIGAVFGIVVNVVNGIFGTSIDIGQNSDSEMATIDSDAFFNEGGFDQMWTPPPVSTSGQSGLITGAIQSVGSLLPWNWGQNSVYEAVPGVVSGIPIATGVGIVETAPPGPPTVTIPASGTVLHSVSQQLPGFSPVVVTNVMENTDNFGVVQIQFVHPVTGQTVQIPKYGNQEHTSPADGKVFIVYVDPTGQRFLILKNPVTEMRGGNNPCEQCQNMLASTRS